MAKRKAPHPQTCERCPHRFEAQGCPAWVQPENGFVEENDKGDVRVVQGCFYQVIPRLMAHVIRAANRPAAVLADWRNEMASGLARIAGVVPQAPLLEHDPDGKRD